VIAHLAAFLALSSVIVALATYATVLGLTRRALPRRRLARPCCGPAAGC
jgi:hypothetical protein